MPAEPGSAMGNTWIKAKMAGSNPHLGNFFAKD